MKLIRLATVPVVVVALYAAVVTPASATPVGAKPLPCSASVSNTHPADYTTVYVHVQTADRAKVVTVAHYKTTNHRKTGRASASGRATIAYYISGATPGYKVKVSVSVSKNGRNGSCSTSFTPHR
jgi:hypothetical protein